MTASGTTSDHTESAQRQINAASALADAITTSRVIDLSVTLAEDLPGAWPSHMPFQRKVYNWYGPETRSSHVPAQRVEHFRGPYQTAWWVLDEHCGTHFDAPTHFIPPPDSGLPHASDFGLQTGERVELDRLIGPAVVIDASHLSGRGAPGESPEITPDIIQSWETEHGDLQEGEIVLFRTLWDQHYRRFYDGGSAYCYDAFATRQAPGWPTPGIPALQYLHDRGVMTVALDGASIGAAHDGAPPHQWGLGRGMLFIELLTNLDQLPPRGAVFIFLPVKVEGSTGGPGRAIALLSSG